MINASWMLGKVGRRVPASDGEIRPPEKAMASSTMIFWCKDAPTG